MLITAALEVDIGADGVLSAAFFNSGRKAWKLNTLSIQ